MANSKPALERRLRRAMRFIENNQKERLAAEIRRCPELINLVIDYNSLLSTAVNSNREYIEFLLDHGVDVDIGRSTVGTELFGACTSGDLVLAKLLLRRGADPNVANEKNETPFSYACAFGFLDIARLLYDNRADINPVHNEGGTPMDDECQDEAIIEFLRKIGAKREAELVE